MDPTEIISNANPFGPSIYGFMVLLLLVAIGFLVRYILKEKAFIIQLNKDHKLEMENVRKDHKLEVESLREEIKEQGKLFIDTLREHVPILDAVIKTLDAHKTINSEVIDGIEKLKRDHQILINEKT